METAYTRLLQATSAVVAGIEWGAVCAGLQRLDSYLVKHASREGPWFLGDEPSLAEAATAPGLFRIAATLPALRNLELMGACVELGLTRLSKWLAEVLARPDEVCDVQIRSAEEYVTLARKLHVRYEGPPTPRSSLQPSHFAGLIS